MTAFAPILLIDTYSLLFRAHHALPPMNTSSGEPTAALYGLSTLLLKLLREQRPRGLAFALDAPTPTFRHERFSLYKSTRAALPSALGPQLARLGSLLAGFGAPSFCAPGYEADDLLATLATELALAGEQPLVVSGDRDLLQLAAASVRVLFVGGRAQAAVLYDEERVRERFGVLPEQLPTWIALVGDSSDNIPGVPGIGPSTAARLIREHGSAAAMLQALPALGSTKVARALAATGALLVEYEHLARLCRNVPLGIGPRYGELGPGSLLGLRDVFSELEFKSLIPRLEALDRQ